MTLGRSLQIVCLLVAFWDDAMSGAQRLLNDVSAKVQGFQAWMGFLCTFDCGGLGGARGGSKVQSALKTLGDAEGWLLLDGWCRNVSLSPHI